ncbi:electron transfer flavoprotein subunit alpha/FixB family protein [Pontiella agarivorans]|uniref:Electron transfer flavoprotein subunit alpha/FixB family protein n=1 Tax=Pontiella agarivorans TaxID=3038953 RepID=A0ABU5N030_9BACT|nr:electron transfer flavoprotein subunit alpha/FixB family protein [Pontiella agarivorans]MDZ8119792.1 electron transfer flavoprotein subunit alpha/FixB family protein [Pontiella agarivorans]
MNELWVFNEPNQPVVDELLAKGRILADQAGMKLCRVSVDLPDFQNDYFTRALLTLVQKRRPQIMLFGATAIGKTLAPTLAAKLGTGLTADCTGLEIDPETQTLKMIRPAYSGNILATVICEKRRPQMATVRSGIFGPEPVQFEDIIIRPDCSSVRKRMQKTQKLDDAEREKLHSTEFIIAGGRGIGVPENFQCLEELAEVLGGAVGASKAVVDMGWRRWEQQVGLSGKTVAPVVYIACGISGAVQHLEGIRRADILVAINNDPEAPIFDYADYGLVGDVLEIVPEMIRQLHERHFPGK